MIPAPAQTPQAPNWMDQYRFAATVPPPARPSQSMWPRQIHRTSRRRRRGQS